MRENAQGEKAGFSVQPCRVPGAWDVVRNSDGRIIYEGLFSRYEAAQNAETFTQKEREGIKQH